MNEFAKIQGNGLLNDYYESEDALSDALRRKRQKLAETKLKIQPSSMDSDNGTNLDSDSST